MPLVGRYCPPRLRRAPPHERLQPRQGRRGEVRRRLLPLRRRAFELPHLQHAAAARAVLRRAPGVLLHGRRQEAEGAHPAMPHQPGRPRDRSVERSGAHPRRPGGEVLRGEPERLVQRLRVPALRRGRRRGGVARRHDGPLRQRRRRGGRARVPRRADRDPRLPVYSPPAEEDAPEAQRRPLPLHHRVRLRPPHHRRRVPRERVLPPRHRRLGCPDRRALPLGLHHLLQLLSAGVPQRRRAAGEPQVLPRPRCEDDVRAGRLPGLPRPLRRAEGVAPRRSARSSTTSLAASTARPRPSSAPTTRTPSRATPRVRTSRSRSSTTAGSPRSARTTSPPPRKGAAPRSTLPRPTAPSACAT